MTTECRCRAPHCPMPGTCCHSLTGCGTHLCIVHDDLAIDLWPAATERIIARELLFSLLWKLQRAPGCHCVPMSLRENAYNAIIQDYASQVALKNAELMNKDLEIARLKLLADKDDERKDNMVRRHYTGKDILQTDIGVPK